MYLILCIKLFLNFRAEREQYIFSKYEQHKYAIITCTDVEELKQDLKMAVNQADMSALLQVYAEGTDLMSVLPEVVSKDLLVCTCICSLYTCTCSLIL